MKIVLLILLVLLTACGKDHTKAPKSKKVVTQVYGNPKLLDLYDAECTKKDALSKLGNTNVFILKQGQQVTESLDLSSYKGNPLGGAFVTTVYHSGKYVDHFNYSSTLKDFAYISTTMEQESKPLYICDDKVKYPMDSIESTALSALFGLEKSYKFFGESMGNTNIPSISLNVNEHYKQEYRIETSDESHLYVLEYVDNAFYSFDDKSITFVPQEMDGSIFGESPAWRIPVIVSHEMGHHILYQLLPAKDTMIHQVIKQYLELPENSLAGAEALKQALQDKQMTVEQEEISKIMLAFHEAFADMFANLSLGSAYNSLNGVSCMSMSRDIDSKYFADKTEKQLTYSILYNYLNKSSNSDEEEGSCNKPDFQDPHDVGAVLAYGMNFFLKSSPMLPNTSKFNLLANWAQEVQKNYSKMAQNGGRSFLKESLKIFFNLVNNNIRIGESQCREISKIFSGVFYFANYYSNTGCSIE